MRATAEENSRAAQQTLDERNAERAAEEQRVGQARRALPAAHAAHAPFENKVVAAQRVVSEAQADLRSAGHELRKSSRLHRHHARRRVEAATDVLAIVEDGLERAKQLAAPTRSSLEDLRKIIDDHHQSNSIRQILDQWNDLEGVVDRADEVCQTLDRWKDWADGREVSPTGLLEIAVALRGHQELPGITQIGESLARWAEAEEVDLVPIMQPIPTLGMGIEP
jgi:hypothetical protein